jgi:hypothetical protein
MCQKLGLAVCLTSLLTGLAVAEPNTLTPQEVEQGWILLWDGKTDFGWEWHGDTEWTFSDGILRAERGGKGWLGTTSMFADFELKLEFRTAADGNSGIFLRSARRGEPHRSGYELQIFDSQPQGFNTGSLVFYQKAKPAKLVPNEWNQYEITVEGSHFLVKLNGQTILDADNPTHAVGMIGLQYNEGKKIEFRNMKLKPLGLLPLLNGKDLSGWTKVDSGRPDAVHEWSARDGMIHVEKGPGQLETEKEFTNLVLQLGVRTNPTGPDHHPNSGVFFRADAGGFWTGYESQIRNEFKHGDRSLPHDFGTGGIYFRQPARYIVAQDGEFFYKTIVAYGRHMAVWVNGMQVSDFQDTRPKGNDPRHQTRLKGGVISLQAHDPTTNLDFKDVRAVELPPRGR